MVNESDKFIQCWIFQKLDAKVHWESPKRDEIWNIFLIMGKGNSLFSMEYLEEYIRFVEFDLGNIDKSGSRLKGIKIGNSWE